MKSYLMKSYLIFPALVLVLLIADPMSVGAGNEVAPGASTTEDLLQVFPFDSTRVLHSCVDNDNTCPRGCSPINDSDCEVQRRVELMERFLRTHQKGNLYTPDPREALLQPKSEVYRLLYGSQALGYLDLYAATGKQPYLREATERLEALAAADSTWSGSARDGDIALAFLGAYEFTGRQEFFDAGIAAARRLADYCHLQGAQGACELNWGMSAALCLAEAHRITGDDRLLTAARLILARTQVFQHGDGSLPHQSDLEGRNLEYSSWVGFQLTNYLLLDPDVVDCHTTTTHRGRFVSLNVEMMLSRLVSFLKRQVNEDGRTSYTGDRKLVVVDPALCRYCSSPWFARCKEYCGQLCGPMPESYPCGCIQDPLRDCPMIGVETPDPMCEYCSNPMAALCVGICRNVCGRDSTQFPCFCVSDPQTQCPRDSMWIETSYYDDWDPRYDTRGWTSELATTAIALARRGEHDTKWKVLNFLFSLQKNDGSFPDKWGYRTEQPNTPLWLWASEEHSVVRTSIVFRVLSSLLVASRGQSFVKSPIPHLETGPVFSPRIAEATTAFPNPSSGGVTLRFSLPENIERVEVIIVDIAGRTVKNLGELVGGGERAPLALDAIDELPGSGVTWDGTDEDGNRVAPGIYFAQLAGDGYRSAKKIVILGR